MHIRCISLVYAAFGNPTQWKDKCKGNDTQVIQMSIDDEEFSDEKHPKGTRARVRGMFI